MPAARGESPRRGRALQSAFHQILLRPETPPRLQRARDRTEARGAGERAHSLPARRKSPDARARGVSRERGVFQVAQFCGRGRDQMIRLGRFLFHWRNVVFPLAYALLFLKATAPDDYV